MKLFGWILMLTAAAVMLTVLDNHGVGFWERLALSTLFGLYSFGSDCADGKGA